MVNGDIQNTNAGVKYVEKEIEKTNNDIEDESDR